jgi:hypothetical protein
VAEASPSQVESLLRVKMMEVFMGINKRNPQPTSPAEGRKDEAASEKNGPIKEIRAGYLRASIWRHERGDGTFWHNVSFSKNYKDGDEWKRTNNFGLEDLPAIEKLAHIAFMWLIKESAV